MANRKQRTPMPLKAANTVQRKRRSPFPFLLRISKGELDNIDGFLNLAKKGATTQQTFLEGIAAKWDSDAPDSDWLVDDFASLDDFAALSAEFAIIGLWRCIELYRKRAIHVASGTNAAVNVFRHKHFLIALAKLHISEKRIRCARTVDELRCLNNAIKHDQHVSGELAEFPRWHSKKESELGKLEPHYWRLRSAAKVYLNDLTDRLSSWHLRRQSRASQPTHGPP
jgi:hypothetical protein